jgi:hypothetical protein
MRTAILPAPPEHPISLCMGYDVEEFTEDATLYSWGDRHPSGVTLKSVDIEQRTNLYTTNLFVTIGAEPRTELLPPSIALDSHGFVLTLVGRTLPMQLLFPGSSPLATYVRDRSNASQPLWSKALSWPRCSTLIFRKPIRVLSLINFFWGENPRHS